MLQYNALRMICTLYHIYVHCIIFMICTLYHIYVHCIIFMYTVSYLCTLYHIYVHCIIFMYTVSYLCPKTLIDGETAFVYSRKVIISRYNVSLFVYVILLSGGCD